MALSREVMYSKGWEVAAAVLAPSRGVEAAGGRAAVGTGVVDANRIKAPFRSEVFVRENWDLVIVLEIDKLGVERRGLARKDL